ncbi:MAG TPA: hypothetical protein VIY49_29165 [Bryobacteraceae bacterium]
MKIPYKSRTCPLLSLLLILASAAFSQTPTVTAVVNTDSFTTALCPGILATVFGSNFGTDPTKAQVMVGGQPAYILTGAFFATQFTVQIPFGIAAGPQTLSVTIAGVQASGFSITLSAVAPAISTLNQAGTELGVFTDAKTGNVLTVANPGTLGETLSTYAIGLGVTTPPTSTGLATTDNPVTPLPTITVGGVNCKVLAAVVVPNYAGLYQINFTLPSSGVQGTVPFLITVGGQSSPSGVTIPIVGVSAVANNASFANPGTIAPGSIASVFANGLGSATQLETGGVFPATTAEGFQITFNGIPAPIFHLIPPVAPTAASPEGSPGQIDLEVPNSLPTSGTVNVQLTTSTTNYANYTLNMVPASPGLYRFTDPKNGNQYVITQFANSAWVVLPTAATADIGLPACTANTSASVECGEPANIGDYLVIYLTGLGLATVNGAPGGATLPLGQNPPASGSPLYETPTMPTVTIGGINATPLFSGLVPGYAGEYQIDVQVPAGVASGDSVPVAVTMMGQSDTANISIQPTRVTPPNQ